MSITRYSFEQDTMEPADDGAWVPFDEIAGLLHERSLRDWFAGQALIGVIMAQEAGGSLTKVQDVISQVRAGGHEARTAYAYADAMLAERSK